MVSVSQSHCWLGRAKRRRCGESCGLGTHSRQTRGLTARCAVAARDRVPSGLGVPANLRLTDATSCSAPTRKDVNDHAHHVHFEQTTRESSLCMTICRHGTAVTHHVYIHNHIVMSTCVYVFNLFMICFAMTWHCTTLHHTALHYTKPHYTTLHTTLNIMTRHVLCMP